MKKYKSPAYLDYLSGFACVVTGTPGADLHHESLIRQFWGAQKKNFDFGALPLNHYLHIEERHAWGREKFWSHYHINPVDLCIELVTSYIERGALDEELAIQALELLKSGNNT